MSTGSYCTAEYQCHWTVPLQSMVCDFPSLHFYQLLNSSQADLYRDVFTAIVNESDYRSPNRTIENAAWSNSNLLPEHGFVALDDIWAASKDLPTTQRWPWDKKKGVYILTSSHELHCVVST